jgi:hypothetical protein
MVLLRDLAADSFFLGLSSAFGQGIGLNVANAIGVQMNGGPMTSRPFGASGSSILIAAWRDLALQIEYEA